MSPKQKASLAAAMIASALLGGAVTQLAIPPDIRRPILVQLKIERGRPAVWAPAVEGLWLWQPLVKAWSDEWLLTQPKMAIVRGVGPRGDDGLIVVVTQQLDGTLAPSDEIKSIRELGPGYWTFLRPLRPNDPMWKGGEPLP